MTEEKNLSDIVEAPVLPSRLNEGDAHTEPTQIPSFLTQPIDAPIVPIIPDQPDEEILQVQTNITEDVSASSEQYPIVTEENNSITVFGNQNMENADNSENVSTGENIEIIQSPDTPEQLSTSHTSSVELTTDASENVVSVDTSNEELETSVNTSSSVSEVVESVSPEASPIEQNTTTHTAAPPRDINGQELAEQVTTENTSEETTTDSTESTQKASPPKTPAKINYNSSAFLKELFANGNECITAPGGSYIISDATRSMLALFSNGRYFVAETHKYDGPPLLFVTDTKRRRLQIGQPEYVPLTVITNIYEHAAKMKNKTTLEVASESQEQARMQRNFVTIVSKAAASRVSDIHIVVADHTTVLFRTNGLMQVEFEYNKEWGESFVRAAFASADISDANYAQNEYQAAQKVGKTALRGSGGKLVLPRNVQGIRLQFNPIAFGTRYVVMRLLYDEDDADTAGDLGMLGFEPHEVDTFYRLRAIPTGIVVVAGPTGSGKSTTLQRNMISMLQERNYELNLITVEDPPEYPIPGARQMPVTNAATEELKDREFTKALAASLRSDPDALMIGEVRTLAAADLAFRGALSGHNVWTTLHANSAPAILMRLKDMGVEDFKLQDPSIMKGLLSQRLFRKICPYCRIRARDRLDNPAVQRLHQAFGDIGVELSYLRGPGCKQCDFRGVKGRTVVGEFVLPDGTFLDLMLRGESKKALDYWVTELNGRTLKEAAQSRMLKGIIDIEEVERWTGLFNDN